MTTALEHIRYSCGIAGEEVANYVDQLTAKVAELEERRCEICGYAEHHREHTGCLRTQLAAAQKEVERLKTVPMKYRRMAFNAQLQDENNELRDQLAAAQAYAEQLRVALQTFIDEHEECTDADDWMAMLCSIEAHHVAEEALALPRDTSALDAHVSEKVKEAVSTQKEYYESVFQDGAKRIANLTRQRDLAVEALEDVKECFDAAEFEGLSDRIREANVECGSLADLVMRRLSPALSTVDHALSAIKESKNNKAS